MGSKQRCEQKAANTRLMIDDWKLGKRMILHRLTKLTSELYMVAEGKASGNKTKDC